MGYIMKLIQQWKDVQMPQESLKGLPPLAGAFGKEFLVTHSALYL